MHSVRIVTEIFHTLSFSILDIIGTKSNTYKTMGNFRSFLLSRQLQTTANNYCDFFAHDFPYFFPWNESPKKHTSPLTHQRTSASSPSARADSVFRTISSLFRTRENIMKKYVSIMSMSNSNVNMINSPGSRRNVKVQWIIWTMRTKPFCMKRVDSKLSLRNICSVLNRLFFFHNRFW